MASSTNEQLWYDNLNNKYFHFSDGKKGIECNKDGTPIK